MIWGRTTTIAGSLISAVAVALISYGLHSYAANRAELAHDAAMATQKTRLEAQCLATQLATYGASHDYQNNLGDIDDRFNALRLSDAPGCVPIESPPRRLDARRSQSAKLPRPHGARVGPLLEIARDADRERAKRRGLQAWIRSSCAPKDLP